MASITIVYEPGDDGWTIASIPEVPGVHSQGQTRAEVRENVLAALSVMLAPDDDAPAGDREAVVLTTATAAGFASAEAEFVAVTAA